MKSSNPLMRDDDFRYLLALGIALEVLLLLMSVAEPWLFSQDRGDIEFEHRLARLLGSWPYLVLGTIYAVSAHMALAKFDERAAIPRLLFYGCLGATLTGNLVTMVRDLDLIWSHSYGALVIARLWGSLLIAPVCSAVLAAELWQITVAHNRRLEG